MSLYSRIRIKKLIRLLFFDVLSERSNRILIVVSSKFTGLVSSMINRMMYFSNIIGVALSGNLFKKIEGKTGSYYYSFKYSLIGVIVCLIVTGYLFQTTFSRKKRNSSN